MRRVKSRIIKKNLKINLKNRKNQKNKKMQKNLKQKKNQKQKKNRKNKLKKRKLKKKIKNQKVKNIYLKKFQTQLKVISMICLNPTKMNNLSSILIKFIYNTKCKHKKLILFMILK